MSKKKKAVKQKVKAKRAPKQTPKALVRKRAAGPMLGVKLTKAQMKRYRWAADQFAGGNLSRLVRFLLEHNLRKVPESFA